MASKPPVVSTSALPKVDQGTVTRKTDESLMTFIANSITPQTPSKVSTSALPKVDQGTVTRKTDESLMTFIANMLSPKTPRLIREAFQILVARLEYLKNFQEFVLRAEPGYLKDEKEAKEAREDVARFYVDCLLNHTASKGKTIREGELEEYIYCCKHITEQHIGHYTVIVAQIIHEFYKSNCDPEYIDMGRRAIEEIRQMIISWSERIEIEDAKRLAERTGLPLGYVRAKSNRANLFTNHLSQIDEFKHYTEIFNLLEQHVKQISKNKAAQRDKEAQKELKKKEDLKTGEKPKAGIELKIDEKSRSSEAPESEFLDPLTKCLKKHGLLEKFAEIRELDKSIAAIKADIERMEAEDAEEEPSEVIGEETSIVEAKVANEQKAQLESRGLEVLPAAKEVAIPSVTVPAAVAVVPSSVTVLPTTAAALTPGVVDVPRVEEVPKSEETSALKKRESLWAKKKRKLERRAQRKAEALAAEADLKGKTDETELTAKTVEAESIVKAVEIEPTVKQQENKVKEESSAVATKGSTPAAQPSVAPTAAGKESNASAGAPVTFSFAAAKAKQKSGYVHIDKNEKHRKDSDAQDNRPSIPALRTGDHKNEERKMKQETEKPNLQSPLIQQKRKYLDDQIRGYNHDTFIQMFKDQFLHYVLSFEELENCFKAGKGELQPKGGSEVRLILNTPFKEGRVVVDTNKPYSEQELRNQHHSRPVVHKKHKKKAGLVGRFIVLQFREAFIQSGLDAREIYAEEFSPAKVNRSSKEARFL